MSTVVESTVSLSRASARRLAEAPRDEHLQPFDAVLQGSSRLPISHPTDPQSPPPAKRSAAEESSASGGNGRPAERSDDSDDSAARQDASSEPAAESGVSDKASRGADEETRSHDAAADGPQAQSSADDPRRETAIGTIAAGQQPAAPADALVAGAPAGDRDSVDRDGSPVQTASDDADSRPKSGRTQARGAAADSLPPEQSIPFAKPEQTGEVAVHQADASALSAVDLQRTELSTAVEDEFAGEADPAAATTIRRKASRQTSAASPRAQAAARQEGGADSALLAPDPETVRQHSIIPSLTVASAGVTEIAAGDGTAHDAAAKTTDGGPRSDATPPSAGFEPRHDPSHRLGSGARVEPNAASGPGPLGQGEAHRFVQRVSRAIELAHHRGESLQIRLSPPELGALRVEIAIRAGVLYAHLEADSAATRAALLDNLPLLRDRLAEQDIRVDRFDVDVRDDTDGRSRGRSPSFAFQDPPGERAEWRSGRRASASRPGPPEPAVAVRLPAWIGDGQLNLLV